MLARLFSFRILLLAVVALPVIAWPTQRALAQDKDDDKKKEGDEGEGEGEEEPGPDKDQPKVTAGGLFTMENYALAEVERPLTITVGMAEVRADISFDLSKDVTFKTWNMRIGGRYGLLDTLELQVGANFTLAAPDGVDKPASISAGIEQAIIYDLVDFRLTAEIPVNPEVAFDVVVGFPIKYRFSDKIAILAAERFFVIHTNGDKPDLTFTVGGMFQAMDNLAIVVRATIVVPQFNGDLITIPLEADLQYTLSNHLDIGLALILGNLKASDPAGPLDARAADIFVRARF